MTGGSEKPNFVWKFSDLRSENLLTNCVDLREQTLFRKKIFAIFSWEVTAESKGWAWEVTATVCAVVASVWDFEVTMGTFAASAWSVAGAG